MYHYGWVRTTEQVHKKNDSISHLWGKESNNDFDYAHIDPITLRLFEGTHPGGVLDCFPKADKMLEVKPGYQLTRREKKNRIGLKLEEWFNLELSKKNFTFVD